MRGAEAPTPPPPPFVDVGEAAGREALTPARATVLRPERKLMPPSLDTLVQDVHSSGTSIDPDGDHDDDDDDNDDTRTPGPEQSLNASPLAPGVASPAMAFHNATMIVSVRTVTLVLVLLSIVMVPGFTLIYFSSVAALEDSIEQSSLLQSVDLSERLNQSFSNAYVTTYGLLDFFQQTRQPEEVLRNTSISEYLNTTVRNFLWSTVNAGNGSIAENGVVLVPHDITERPERLAYSHIWFDLTRRDEPNTYDVEYVYGYHHPDEPDVENNTAWCNTVLIDQETGRNIDPSYRFTCEGYIQIPTWNTSLPAVDAHTEHEHRPLRYRAARYRTPNIWFSSGGSSYVFSAFEAFFDFNPHWRGAGAHPWAEYVGKGGGVLFQSYFLFEFWRPIIDRASVDGVSCYAYDKRSKFVYASPTADTAVVDKSQTDSCTPLRAQGQLGVGTCVPIADDAEQVGPLLYGLYKMGPTGDEPFDGTLFKLGSIKGVRYYVRYTSVYRARTVLADGASADEYDIVLAWAKKFADVQQEVEKALKIVVGFSAALAFVIATFHLFHSLLFAYPLDRLTKAAKAMAVLDLQEAKNCMVMQSSSAATMSRAFRISEIDQLTSSFHRTLRHLQEVMTYLPQHLREGLLLGGSDDAASSRDTRYRGRRTAAEPTADLLIRLRDTGMHQRQGTVLAVSHDGGDKAVRAFVQEVLRASRTHDGTVVLTSPSLCIITWNVRCHSPQHEVAAIRCAVDLASVSAGYRTAVATGQIFTGTVGDETTRTTTCCGEPLEIVRALLPLTTCLGVPVVTPNRTWGRVRHVADGRVVDFVQIGSQDLLLHEVLSTEDGLSASRSRNVFDPGSPRQTRMRELYEDAFHLMCSGAYDAAERMLANCSSQDRQVFRLLHVSRLRAGAVAVKPEYQRCRRVPWDVFDGEFGYDVECGQATTAPRTELSAFDDAKELERNLLQGQSQAALYPTPAVDRSLSMLGPIARAHSELGDRQQSYVSQRSHLSRTESHPYDPTATFFGDATQELPQEVYEADLSSWVNEPQHTALPDKLLSTNQREVWSVSKQLLGVGSFGRVHLGMTTNGELVALKILPVDMRSGGSIVKDLVNEVAVLSNLRHDNIVAYHGSALCTLSADSGHLAICMEYMPGGNLSGLVKEFGRFGEVTCQRYGLDMLRGLQYLHSEGIMHRDLKPGNVLVGEGCCKLADFGSCSRISNVAGQSPDTDLVGTVEYMAPEVIFGERHFGSDMWAFALTLCELLDGALPYPDIPIAETSRETWIYALAIQDPPLRPRLPAPLSNPARDVCEACLKDDVQQRPTAEQLLQLPFFADVMQGE